MVHLGLIKHNFAVSGFGFWVLRFGSLSLFLFLFLVPILFFFDCHYYSAGIQVRTGRVEI